MTILNTRYISRSSNGVLVSHTSVLKSRMNTLLAKYLPDTLLILLWRVLPKRPYLLYALDLRGRERPLDVISIHCCNDYPKFTDSYILEALWGDTWEELTDEELDLVNETQGDIVFEAVSRYLF